MTFRDEIAMRRQDEFPGVRFAAFSGNGRPRRAEFGGGKRVSGKTKNGRKFPCKGRGREKAAFGKTVTGERFRENACKAGTRKLLEQFLSHRPRTARVAASESPRVPGRRNALRVKSRAETAARAGAQRAESGRKEREKYDKGPSPVINLNPVAHDLYTRTRNGQQTPMSS